MKHMTDLPEIIYHYCSVTGFHGILSSKALWLSDCYLMNDHMEHRLLLEKASHTIKSLVENKNTEYYKRGGEELSDHLGSTDNHPFVCCFSREPDLLSQWRAYSDNGAGFAIGFSTDGLRRRCEEHKANKLAITLQPVEYVSAKHDSLGHKIVSRYLDEYEKHSQEAHSVVIFELPWRTYCELWREAALCKNPGFAEEKEYRIVLEPSRRLTGIPRKWVETVGCSDLAFRVSGNRLVPYYELSFTADDVVRIGVGPRFPDRKSIHTIRMFLEKHGYGRDTKIYESAVSYQ